MSTRRQFLFVRHDHRGDLVRLVTFMVVAVLLGSFLFVVVANLRAGDHVRYHAVFSDASGLEAGDDVRVAGVSVGRVRQTTIGSDNLVRVDFDLRDTILLTETTTATVRYKNLIGDRYLQLDQPGEADARVVPAGATVPKSRTGAALELDTLLNGFKPLFAGLSPTQINQLSQQLVAVLQGQASAVTTLISTVNSFATTIGNRNELVGQVIDNLNTVLGTLDQDDDALGSIVDQVSALADGLEGQASDVLAAADQIDALSVDAAALLGDARPDIAPSLASLQATAKTLNRNEEFVEKTIRRMPNHYRLVLRTASFGNFFNFFLCGVQIRLSDEGVAEPVELPWALSDVTRCQR